MGFASRSVAIVVIVVNFVVIVVSTLGQRGRGEGAQHIGGEGSTTPLQRPPPKTTSIDPRLEEACPSPEHLQHSIDQG